jgi:hypothetical protein
MNLTMPSNFILYRPCSLSCSKVMDIAKASRGSVLLLNCVTNLHGVHTIAVHHG